MLGLRLYSTEFAVISLQNLCTIAATRNIAVILQQCCCNFCATLCCRGIVFFLCRKSLTSRSLHQNMDVSYKNVTIGQDKIYFQLCFVPCTRKHVWYEKCKSEKNAPAVVHNVCRELINFKGNPPRRKNKLHRDPCVWFKRNSQRCDFRKTSHRASFFSE